MKNVLKFIIGILIFIPVVVIAALIYVAGVSSKSANDFVKWTNKK